jgi:hypothetical protein
VSVVAEEGSLWAGFSTLPVSVSVSKVCMCMFMCVCAGLCFRLHTVMKISWLMLFKEIITLYSENHTKTIS